MKEDQQKRSKRSRSSKSHILTGILATVLFMTLYMHNRTNEHVLEGYELVMKASAESSSQGRHGGGTGTDTDIGTGTGTGTGTGRIHMNMNMNISRKEVMSVLKKMHNGNYVKKGYFKHLLMESKKMLHSLDNVYDVAFPVPEHVHVPPVSGETNSEFDEESELASASTSASTPGGNITVSACECACIMKLTANRFGTANKSCTHACVCVCV